MWIVLIVDDSAVARRVLARRLETEGFQVREASSLATARKVNLATLGCAIVDLELADGDGTDLARTFLEKRPGLPVAFFTQGSAPSLLEGARSRGQVFLKPDLNPVVAWVRRSTRPSQPPPTEMNDLDLVALHHPVLGVPSPGDHLAVDLDRDGALGQPEVLDEAAHRQPVGHVLARAIDRELHGRKPIIAVSSTPPNDAPAARDAGPAGPPSRLVRLSELARFWGLHTRTLQAWIREGRLAALRSPGNHFRLRVADVRAFCEREGMTVPPFVSPPARRVVVAGASPSLRRTLGRTLRAVSVEAAADPYEALVTAAIARPELLALGLGEARFDAPAAVRALHKNPETAAIAVVAFDVPSRPQAAALERAGAARTLLAAKPAEQLTTVIAELLGL